MTSHLGYGYVMDGWMVVMLHQELFKNVFKCQLSQVASGCNDACKLDVCFLQPSA